MIERWKTEDAGDRQRCLHKIIADLCRLEEAAKAECLIGLRRMSAEGRNRGRSRSRRIASL